VSTSVKIHRAMAALALLGLAAGSAAAALAAGSVASWSSTHTLEVTDPQYQMTAYTVPVPAGWKSTARVSHTSGCHGTGAGLSSTVRSPDGSTTIIHLPGVRWSWSSNPIERQQLANAHCAAIDIDSAASFLLNIAIPNLQPGAAITAILPLDEQGQASLRTQLENAKHSSEQTYAGYHLQPPKLTIDGARVRIRFLDHGKLMEEQVQAVIDCNETQTPAMYKMPSSTRRGCSARNVYIVRTPQGQLADFLGSPALAKLNQGLQMDQQWWARVSKDLEQQAQASLAKSQAEFQQFMRQAQANHEAMLARGRQFQQQEQQQFERSQALDQAKQSAIDQAAHGQVLVSLGRKDFINPATGQTIEANAYYDHQWLSSDGSTLIQTDNPSLDPNGVVYPVSQSWTELEPK
jgi:hypothetical protein